uniref:Ionotropic glutamate receptor C-terminal domain-containing protein n=1 Tax=Photinus pyralis TaxID=7054 RepID=A0A1Y1K8X7_PHOPY
MKVTTFAPCVIFVSFLISSTCNISLKNNPTPWKICVEKVIQTIFGDETLHCVFNESMDLLPSNIRNPRVVINISNPIPRMNRVVAKNFILEVGNLDFLKKFLNSFRFVGIWTEYEPVNARLLVITDHLWRVEMIFSLLWRHGFTYVAVLVINKDEDGRSSLFTANPYDVQNHCGYVPHTIHVQRCDYEITDPIERPIRNYHGCSVVFHFTMLTQYSDKFDRKSFTISMVVEMLNVTLDQSQKSQAKIGLRDELLVSGIKGGYRMSHVYTRDIIVWIVPPTTAISALEILAVNFDLEVWILVSVIFAIFTMAWYVLDKFKTSLGEIVLKTFGITLFGSTSRITQSSKLRFVILCYIIYSVHIQTAYVSNLMRLMSSPPRRQPIRNLKELLEADIPMCMDSSATYVSNSHMVPEIRKIYDKIVVRSCPIRSHDPRVLLERWSARPNFSIAIPLKTLHALALDLRLRIPNYFIDKHILPPLMQTFAYGRSGSIIDSLNIIIDRLIDSGLYDKLDRDRSSYDDSKRRELPQDEEVVALSLEHLNGIFIVFCFGMVLSIMAFIGERIAHRFSMSH